VTINSPQRRVDVALPDAVPVAEILPELLRHAGEGLADDGQRHGGWLLRRADGVALTPSAALGSQDVRDGSVLHLVPARDRWPELEYDDVVEAIAAGARRQGKPWNANATRVTGLIASGVTLAVGLVTVWFSGPTRQHSAVAALAVAVLLLISGVLASRAYGDSFLGAVLAAFGLPFAFLGGLLVLVADQPYQELTREELTSYLLIAAVALLLASLIGAVGVGHALRVFAAGATAGLIGVLGALIAFPLGAAGSGAIVIGIGVSGIAALPLLAIRLGKLPMPVLTLPSDVSDAGHTLAPPPHRAKVFAAVARTDEMLTGMLLGVAICLSVSLYFVGAYGGVSGQVLTGAASGALLLRARLFLTVRQRLPLLGAGLVGLALLAIGAATTGTEATNIVIAAALAVIALIIALMAARNAAKEPSPYLGRAADLLDVVCVVSVIPIACGVLGLYGLARGVIG
jgi:type VII secretion integral membrane protein EccD